MRKAKKSIFALIVAGIGVCVLVVLLFPHRGNNEKISENQAEIALSDYYYYTDDNGDADDSLTLIPETRYEENVSGHYYFIDNEGNIDDALTLIPE